MAEDKLGKALQAVFKPALPLDILLTKTGGDLTKEEQKEFTWKIMKTKQ